VAIRVGDRNVGRNRRNATELINIYIFIPCPDFNDMCFVELAEEGMAIVNMCAECGEAFEFCPLSAGEN
jgi:hypothetical protein